MLHHGYGEQYSQHLGNFVLNLQARLTICEFGIFKGQGLAIWCDLFPNSRCIGFDIDCSAFENNLSNLIRLGAFQNNEPEVHVYDQYIYSPEYLEKILCGDRIDICIDDGNHSDESILTTIRSAIPHLNEEFVYFVEDNSNVHREISPLFPHCNVHTYGLMTVVEPSSNKENYG